MFAELTRRRHPRISASFPVRLLAGKKTLTRNARNVSMTGLLVEGGGAEGESVKVEIALPNEQRKVIAESRVIREDTRHGITALYFRDVDLNGMFALARFLAPRLP